MSSLFILNDFSKYEFTFCLEFIFSKDEFFFYPNIFYIEFVFSKDQFYLKLKNIIILEYFLCYSILKIHYYA